MQVYSPRREASRLKSLHCSPTLRRVIVLACIIIKQKKTKNNEIINNLIEKMRALNCAMLFLPEQLIKLQKIHYQPHTYMLKLFR